MTPDGFRRLALRLPEAVESAHMGHPDFRVGGRVFASLGHPDAGSGMVKLTPEQQEAVIAAEPDVFAPAAGAWGRGGATTVKLARARTPSLRTALGAAWANVAPRSLAARESVTRPRKR